MSAPVAIPAPLTACKIPQTRQNGNHKAIIVDTSEKEVVLVVWLVLFKAVWFSDAISFIGHGCMRHVGRVHKGSNARVWGEPASCKYSNTWVAVKESNSSYQNGDT